MTALDQINFEGLHVRKVEPDVIRISVYVKDWPAIVRDTPMPTTPLALATELRNIAEIIECGSLATSAA